MSLCGMGFVAPMGSGAVMLEMKIAAAMMCRGSTVLVGLHSPFSV